MDSPHNETICQPAGERAQSSVDLIADEVRVRAGVLESTVHLRCPRCGLAMFARPRWIAAKHCPRCVARAHKLVVLLTDFSGADRLALPVKIDGAQCLGGTR
jgi:hypothetical protein